MNYKKENLKNGITIHKINTNKFKTNLFSVFLTTKLNKENVTKNALLTAILRRGTANLTTQELINKKLEELYGASFDCGVDKTGDNHVLKFYLECINNEFLPIEENLSKEALEILLDIVFNPYIENNGFKEEYLKVEKENLKQIIEGKIDNKSKYAYDRCVEEMYKNGPYGLYKYGYVEDLDKIDSYNLYEYYKELIKKAKIDVFISGDFEEDNIVKEINNNVYINQLSEREAEYIVNGLNDKKEIIENPNIVNESMDITQGKLVIGMDVLDNSKENRYVTTVYNTILGGSANSKMFQNVREKASLAYSAGSVYLKQKDNIFIKCGIEICNYEKAVALIKEQLKQMEQGDFSEEDVNNAKNVIEASVLSIPESQDSEINFYFSQELSNENITMKEFVEKVSMVNKEQIMNIAKKMQINTIYFLKD